MEAGGPSSERRRRVGEDDGGGADRISDLPDAVLGDIISLLPTQEGARTQILASRWRHLWRSAPLNLDSDVVRCLWVELPAVVSRILSSHQGPGRCFRTPNGSGTYKAGTVDSWLQSPAVDNLRELFLCYPIVYQLPLPLPLLSESAFRLSTTLRVATIKRCQIPEAVQRLQFPQLKQLALAYVGISECSLHHVIAGCPALECLLIYHSFGFSCVRINSVSLRSIGVRAAHCLEGELKFRELIIENAPRLEKLLHLDLSSDLHVSVSFAPKLETLRWSPDPATKISFGSTVIQSFKSGPNNLWLRKHQNLIKCHDISLKKIVFETYWGIKSQVSFLTFFILNVRDLELMTVRYATNYYNEEFLAEHRRKLQLENRASRGALFRFTTEKSLRTIRDINDIHDLDLTDPFAC